MRLMVSRKLVLFDIDGVLANDEHRVHFAISRDWDSYFAPYAMLADTIWQPGYAALCAHLAAGDHVGYLTGRRDDTRAVTERWMARYALPAERLLMRAMGDKRVLAEVKATKIAKLKLLYRDVILYEDDPYICEYVTDYCGAGCIVHCKWSNKPEEMIKRKVSA